MPIGNDFNSSYNKDSIKGNHFFVMASTKTFKFTVSDTGSTRTEFIEAVNPPQAKRMAEARYPGCRLFGFNQVN